jgi:predicted nucleic acid-binding protein
MSVVVADNSPIDVLVRLGYQEVLPNLFGRVVIPIQVQSELLEGAARRDLIGLADAFRRIQTETDFRIRPELLAARLKELHNWRKEQLDGG